MFSPWTDQLVIITFNTLYSKTHINRIYRPFFLNKLQQFLSFFQGPLLKFLLGQKPFLPELCWPEYEVWCSFRLPEKPEVYYNISFNKGAYIQNVVCSNWCVNKFDILSQTVKSIVLRNKVLICCGDASS